MRLPRHTARRALPGIVLTLGLVVGATAPAQASSAPTPPATSAANWLAGQLDKGLVVSQYYDGSHWVSYTDYGLSLDFFFAFSDLGIRAGKRHDILDAIEPEMDNYIDPGTTYAGAVGKLLTAVETQGIDPSTYGSGDLVTQLEGLVHTASDSEHGRAEDSPSTQDTSNTVGQSFVVRALVAAQSDLADDAIAFLLKQQCSNGFFRVYMESSDHTCDGGTAEERGPSVDATAAAVQALLTAKTAGTPGVNAVALNSAISSARGWLVDRQRSSGGFAEDGIVNSNSTGLAAQVLVDLGKTARAADAAEWLNQHRVTRVLAARTALKSSDVGAVAFDGSALNDGKHDGITRDTRYQWRRATAQAVSGLDALRYG
jgi:hypothetical protein